MSETIFKPLLNERETAKLLGVSRGTLQVWRSTRRYPALEHTKIGSAVRYRPETIEAFIQSRTVTATEPRHFAKRRQARKEHISALKAASRQRKTSRKKRSR
jgi:predicted DNA-binding transcriptional regulator AlpA